MSLSGVRVRRGEVEALTDVNLTVERGDFLAVIGPNGGGKTTLLKVLLGLIRPDAGTVTVLGGPAGRSAGVGYLPQSAEAGRDFPVTVLDLALMGRLGRRRRFFRDREEDVAKARAALALVGMTSFEDRRASELSGGQRQRVLIARALAAEPELLLLDEPANGVDARGREELYDALRELNRGMTIVMVSHEVGVVARCVKSVACVDRCLHHHPAPEITPRMFSMLYGGSCPEACPVEIFAHGVPHRVAAPHDPASCQRCAQTIGRALGEALAPPAAGPAESRPQEDQP